MGGHAAAAHLGIQRGVTPVERYFTRIENFLSYALLHVVYNLNIKGKGRS